MTSYPTLIIGKSPSGAFTLLHWSSDVDGESRILKQEVAQSASMEENEDLPAYISIPYAAFCITILFGDP